MEAKQSLLFFSYARVDAEFALKLAKSLRSAGANLWIDQLDIHAGDHWDRAVEQALKKAESLLIILSPAAVDSKNVMDEVSFALEENKPVVPVLYKQCNIPFRLRRVQHVDFTADFGHGLERLLNDLAIKRASKEPQPAEPVPADHLPPPHRSAPEEELTAQPEPVEIPKAIRTKPPPHEPALPKPSAEKTFTNSIGMEFVFIPAGSFTMGSRFTTEELLRQFGGKREWNEWEKPFHPVKIKRHFYFQTTPVTQRQWQHIMEDKPSLYKDGREVYPVEQVSWYEAQEFIRKLNNIEKTTDYRLPSEAEWEYACRAANDAEFSFGDEVKKLDNFAWCSINSDGKTHPVGEKEPNAFGLYDMHGNVWEWVEDDWHGSYKGAPNEAIAWVDDPRGSDRVIRGGCWFSDPHFCRSAARINSWPGGGNVGLGFRLSWSVSLGP